MRISFSSAVSTFSAPSARTLFCDGVRSDELCFPAENAEDVESAEEGDI
jgi:hypothetical protein